MNLLAIQALSKRYVNDKGISNFTLMAKAGDRILLLGPNGAGKTTVMRAAINLISADSGRVNIVGNDINTARVEALSQVGCMIGSPGYYSYLTGVEHLLLLTKIYANTKREDAFKTLQIVGLADAARQKVGSYSTGMKRRLALAMALFHQPKVLLLDEPFSGIDIHARHTLKEMLINIQATRELAIVISSHMASDLEGFANRVIVINRGKTLYHGDMSTLTQNKQTIEQSYLALIDKDGGAH